MTYVFVVADLLYTKRIIHKTYYTQNVSGVLLNAYEHDVNLHNCSYLRTVPSYLPHIFNSEEGRSW